MKVKQARGLKNEHVIVIEQGGEERLYFSWATKATTDAVLSTLLRDIARHGTEVVDFVSKPIVFARLSRRGRKVYDVTAALT